jgi:hypothetical protein
MVEANNNTTTAASIADQVKDGLSEMESPLVEVRNLAYAARMLGSADDMPRDPGAALDTLADQIVTKMDELIEERERLWQLAEGGER